MFHGGMRQCKVATEVRKAVEQEHTCPQNCSRREFCLRWPCPALPCHPPPGLHWSQSTISPALSLLPAPRRIGGGGVHASHSHCL